MNTKAVRERLRFDVMPATRRGRGVYEERVRAAILAICERRRISKQELADLLTERLGRQIRKGDITRYTTENAYLVTPQADLFAAVLELGGFDLSREGILRPDSALDSQVQDLHAQLAAIMPTMRRLAATAGESIMALPEADGDPDAYLTSREAAALAGVTRQAVHQWIGAGMPAYRRGRHRVVRREDVEKRIRKR